MDNDDDIDTSGIPDFPPEGQWVKGPPQLIKDISQLRDMFIPAITRDGVIGKLWLLSLDGKNKNTMAQIKALETICKLKGWLESHSDIPEENTDNLTLDEIKAIKSEFENSY